MNPPDKHKLIVKIARDYAYCFPLVLLFDLGIFICISLLHIISLGEINTSFLVSYTILHGLLSLFFFTRTSLKKDTFSDKLITRYLPLFSSKPLIISLLLLGVAILSSSWIYVGVVIVFICAYMSQSRIVVSSFILGSLVCIIFLACFFVKGSYFETYLFFVFPALFALGFI